jgi:hypothetical protein
MPWTPRIDTPRRVSAVIVCSAVASPGVVLVSTDQLGQSGFLLSFSADQLCWVTLYSSAAARTADSSRAIDVDPADDAGVLADLRITQINQTLQLPRGLTYGNLETPEASVIYGRVRTEGSGTLVATLTMDAVVLTD